MKTIDNLWWLFGGLETGIGRTGMRQLFGILLAGCFFLLGAGCSDDAGRVGAVRILSGLGQSAAPGEKFDAPLTVECLTGEDGEPAPDRPVRAEPLPGSDLLLEETRFRTDAGGVIRIPVAAGNRVGDHYLRVVPEDAPSQAVEVRFVTGVRISGGGQEGPSGRPLAEPLVVRLYDSGGVPAAGRPVYFEAEPGSGATVEPECAVTGSDGIARSRITPGDATGPARIVVKPAAADGSLLSRGVAVEIFGMNFWLLLLNACAGLAIFVFGMQLMSDGLQKAAGERMKGILCFFSQNRFVAMLAGAVVTAVIQSSSATTVMVIGFINAGLLNLAQSIGIIIGTNIGTTMTAQIVSFDVGVLAMPAIIVGLLLSFIRRKNLRGIGETVLGFGFLFFGMEIMSDELTGIGGFHSVQQLFARFDCTPVGGIMPFGAVMGALAIGLAVTMIIQSSSASTGIVIALGASGLINFYTAVPLVLGANIGTTVTAQLAAIPANRVAKQAALAHTLFNVIGVLVMLLFFYVPWNGVPVFFRVVDWLTPGDAFSALPQNVPRHIANAHTLFNVFTAILLLPAARPLAKICERLIPVRKKKIKFTNLDPYLLETPAIALQQSVLELRRMVRSSWALFERTLFDSVLDGTVNDRRREERDRREAKIDRMQQEITDYLTGLMRRPLSAAESQAVPVITHCVNDAERLGDYAGSILAEASHLAEARIRLPKKAERDLRELFSALDAVAGQLKGALEEASPERIARARERYQLFRRLAAKIEDAHLENLRKGDYDAATGVIFIGLVGILLQAGERLGNIVARAPELIQFDRAGAGRR